jgi:hypothetical protein
MGKPDTLMDMVLRESYTKIFRMWDKTSWFQRTILEARRFVLDDEMSAMTADLAFAGAAEHLGKAATPRTMRDITSFLESIRTSSRLPYPVTWIEFSMRERSRRRDEIKASRGSRISPAETGDMPKLCGWLLVQHPQVETAVMCIECSSTTFDRYGEDSDTPGIGPIAWAWSTETDGIVPWSDRLLMSRFSEENTPASWLTGFPFYNSRQVTLLPAPWVDRKVAATENFVTKVLSREYLEQMSSDLRYAWALLATINSLPTRMVDVKPDKGFIARGSYKKFLSHQVVRLTIPTVQARRLVARIKAARRRAHEVRGHWREDRWHPGSPNCKHTWSEDHCTTCGAQRFWIHKHQRGDASLGFVTHSYEVSKGHD